ncbi:MAG: NUDIX hydrolase [Thermacetogeniaceae bacterium]|jgi:ADP-ribose pyrophosphatase|nr:NUDIX hydrolase [Syntrophomonadaceae bacterium]
MEKGLEGRLKEKLVSSEEVFQGRIIKVQVDTVELPDGKTAKREVVKHPGAVVILPLTDEGEVVMVRQYRHAPGEILLELPAGKRDGGEEPLECAKRELEEETGYTAEQWQVICSFYTSPGFCDELLYLVLAKGLIKGEARPDEGEFIDVVTIPLAEAAQMVLSGEIKDGKTCLGILAGCALHDHDE